MSSEWELDEGIKSIKSAWWREHTARTNLEKMLEQAKAENAKLRELCADVSRTAFVFCEDWAGTCSKEAARGSLYEVCPIGDASELCVFGELYDRMREMGIEVRQ